MIELSVVLISKDQEWNIARLVESVIRETASLSSREIILIDSASTDRTTEIAAQYPISILKLCPDQRLTAAAGRYIGYKQTTGDLVLFLDGDMELCRGWLDQALQIIRSHSQVATVTGKIINLPIATLAPHERLIEPLTAEIAGYVNVRQGGGAAMYCRSVLDQVGTFNPYLFSDEEPELCLRIRHAGFRIIQLTRPIAYHYTAPAEAISTYLGKLRGNLWLGYGQNMRYFFGTPLLWPYLRERGWALAPALVLVIGIGATVVSGLTGNWGWLMLWGGFVIMLPVVIAIRKRNLKLAILSLLRRLFILDGTVRGLLLKPFSPSDYPGRYEVIQ